jgi:hypothetical protein
MGLNSKEFHKELKFIFKGSCVINTIIYLLSLIFQRNVSILLGLILGTFVLYINLNLLRHDLDNAVRFKHSRLRLMSGYLLRYLLIGTAFYFAVNVEVVNPFGVVVVQTYPKILYTLKSIFNKERSC